ncbi:MAG: hypothetical protein HC793_02835, partial [Aquincola sp.]|nr:hypothetical protein [Aquincola sp.]
LPFCYFTEGPRSVDFFFGSVFSDEPPAAAAFERAKYVMQLVALPLTLLAGAVVIGGLSGLAAVAAALRAGATHWRAVVVIGVMALAFEWASARLPMPAFKPAAVALTVVLLVMFLAWAFAFTYAVSARVFGLTSAERAA